MQIRFFVQQIIFSAFPWEALSHLPQFNPLDTFGERASGADYIPMVILAD